MKRIDADPSRIYLTKTREGKLREHLQARALVAHPGSGPAPLEGTMAEFAFAAVVAPSITQGEAHVLSHRNGAPVRSVKSNDKDFFDVVIESNKPGSKNPAWQVKTLNNRNRRDDAVLLSIRPEDIGYKPSMKAREMAERVFAKIREKQAADEERWQIDDSRCIFFWGDPKENQMFIWQEPYYPGEIDLDAFEWRKQDSGGFVGYLDDKPCWSWYPRGGQLKHKVHIPEQVKRLAVPLPEQALSIDEFKERMLQTPTA